VHVDLDQEISQLSFHSTVCIVGGGIAGLILAKKLADGGVAVHVLEAGGLEQEDRSQALYEAQMASTRHSGTFEGRFRTFGGSSTRWGAQLLPYTADVFQPPPGSSAQPWPITEQDVAPYYDELLQLMQAGTLPFGPELLQSLGHPLAPFTEKVAVRYSKWAPFARRNLAGTVGRACIEHDRVTVFTHANVASLLGSEQQMRSARVVNYTGTEFSFTADIFVVAAGTVESSRLLLCSPEVMAKNDLIGRYFHDHVSFHAAEVSPADRGPIFAKLGPFFVDGVLLTPKIEASAALMNEAGLLSVMAHFPIAEPEGSGIAAVRNVLVAIQRRTRPPLSAVLGVVSGLGDVARLVWATRIHKRRAVTKRAAVWLNIDMEQPAVRENRILLSEETDSLGIPKAIVDWRVTPAEGETAIRFARVLQDEFARAGFHVDWLPGLLEGTPPTFADTYHAMGGLRMGNDPAASMVDGNLKAHSVQNLYVASCAVYPSGGSSNPTFTLMALAMRLAEHLLQQLNEPVVPAAE
jgi:choline dehydrogenase-like flavoprotein